MTGITYPSTATNSFSYNGLDTRVGKTDSGGTFSYVRDGAVTSAPVLGDGAATYTPGVSQHRSSATTFENQDYLGSSTRQTNSSQTTTATRSYDAFGNLVSTTGTPVGPFGFVGKEGYQEDSDSGLKLLGHRYYDPSTGRFLTRDHAKDGRNWYVYCRSNPAKWADPSGNTLPVLIWASEFPPNDAGFGPGGMIPINGYKNPNGRIWAHAEEPDTGYEFNFNDPKGSDHWHINKWTGRGWKRYGDGGDGEGHYFPGDPAPRPLPRPVIPPEEEEGAGIADGCVAVLCVVCLCVLL